MTDPREFAIERDGVSIACIDHPSDGPPLVLLPGFGSNVLSLGRLVRRLADFRIVTIDLRGHGLSDEPDTVTMDDVVDDVVAVSDHLDLGNPAVGGHSLGGVVAVRYGMRHPGCPGVINIDGGHGIDSDPEIFRLLTEEERADWDRLVADSRAQADEGDEPAGDEAWLDEQIAGLTSMAGRTSPNLERFLRRDYGRGPDGLYRRRPSRAFRKKMLDAIDDRGTAAWTQIDCPLLVVVTTQRPPGSADILRKTALTRAAGLEAKRGELRAAGRAVTVVTKHATHQGVVSDAASELAEAIRSFLVGR